MEAGRTAPIAAAAAVVAAAYATTAARTVTRWDAGEFLSAIHSLGIPHPPGTPLYILAAKVWTMLPLPGTFAFRVSFFSALCAAAAAFCLGLLVQRWTRDTAAGAVTTLCAGGTSSVWLSATEAEVYAPALLLAVLLLVVADSVASEPRRWALLAFVAALGWTLHPMSLVLLPAAVMLAWDSRSSTPNPPMQRLRALLSARRVAAIAGAAALGASVVLFLILRSQHDPAVNQGNPATFGALWEVLTRAQYPSTGIWPRQAPLWLQLGNWLEYADWQFARSLAPLAPPAVDRTAVTLVYGALGLAGVRVHHRLDRRSWRALTVAFVSATVVLVLYLNMRLSPSYGHGLVPEGSPREARERDYFFIPAFAIWSAWAALGAAAVGRRVAGSVRSESRRLIAGGVSLAVGAAPLALNFDFVRAQRLLAARDTRATTAGILEKLPRNAVMLAIGDNDTYPMWYVQVVEGVRRDVTVVTVPLLGTRWYRDELARRHSLLDIAPGGTPGVVAAVCRAAAMQGRAVVLTPFATSTTLTTDCPELQLFAEQGSF